ncbi:MAG: photosystem II protein Y [Cyanobacteria bacterium P01_D01_bin.105]
MQFIRRETPLPDSLSILGLDARVALVLIPLVLSVIWNVFNYGKPTLEEIQRVLRGESL